VTKTTAPKITEVRRFDIEDCIFGVDQASAHLGISRSYFYELIADKKITACKIGKRTKIKGVELLRFMNSLEAVS
jgi:excisionase family DNA binding protein